MSLSRFSKLWKAYPRERKSYCLGVTNQCAVRMSIALEESGLLTLGDFKSEFKGQGAWGGYCHSPAKKQPFLVTGAEPLANFLWSRAGNAKFFGRPQVFKSEGENFFQKVCARIGSFTGIILVKDHWQRPGEAFSSRTGDHIDLWNRQSFPAIGGNILAMDTTRPRSYIEEAKEVWFFQVV